MSKLSHFWPIALMVVALAVIVACLETKDRRSTALQDAVAELKANAITIHRLDSIGHAELLAHRATTAKLEATEATVKDLLGELAAAAPIPMDTIRIAGDTTPRYAVPIPTVEKWTKLGASCSALMHDCDADRAAAAARIQTLEAELALTKRSTAVATRVCVQAAQPGLVERLTGRLGVTAGYGATRAPDGHVYLGPQLTAGVRLWP